MFCNTICLNEEREREKKKRKERKKLGRICFYQRNFDVVLFIYLLKLCVADIMLRKVIVRCFPGVLLRANSANINVTLKACF